MSKEAPGKPLKNMSDAELEQEMKRRKKEKEKEQKRAKERFIADKDHFVTNAVHRAKDMRSKLQRFKAQSIDYATQLHNRMFELHEKEPKDQKGFSIVNEQQTMKVVIEKQERFEFTEEANVAIEAIREFFKSKFEQRAKTIYHLLDDLLMKNKRGDYDPKLLTKLRSRVREIDDAKLTEAYELLEDCKVIAGSSTYMRVYETDENGRWKDVTLQFSAL